MTPFNCPPVDSDEYRDKYDPAHRLKIFWNYRKLVDRRLKDGWNPQPYKGRDEILWPPAKPVAEVEAVKIGPTLFIPHWGLE